MTRHLDAEMVAAVLQESAMVISEENESALEKYEIRLIDAGASDAARAFLLNKYRDELTAKAAGQMRRIAAWLATDPQSDDRLNLRQNSLN